MNITNKKNIVFFTYGSSSSGIQIRQFAQADFPGSFLKVEDLILRFENEELPSDYIENTLSIYAVYMNGDIYEVTVGVGVSGRKVLNKKAIDARGRYSK